MSTSHFRLSAASENRKARLAQLRGIKWKQPDESAASESEPPPSQKDEPDVARQHFSGRNYDFETKGPKLGFEHMPNEGLDKPTLEEQAAEVEAEVQRQAVAEAQADKGIDLLKLRPKRPNWDLKRNLERKIEILNVRTDNAIANIVRQRISGASASKPVPGTGNSGSELEDGASAALDGLALVEGIRIKEQDGLEAERRECDEDEALMA